MAEPLSDYLDRMIYSLYGSTQRGYGYVTKDPSLWDVIEYIEDGKTGRPVPIEDSADHFLLRSFDRLRQYFRAQPVSTANGKFGRQVQYGVTFECNECSGEVPWRTLHKE